MKSASPLRRGVSVALIWAIGTQIQTAAARAEIAPRSDNSTPKLASSSPIRRGVMEDPTLRRRMPTGYNTGMPFGLVGPQEIELLGRYAKKLGVDLVGDTRLAYDGDEAALARVFVFSTRFDRLDANARAYGQIVYSAMLNLGERRGLPWFAKIVAAQPPEVRQRVRDFLFYDATQAPRKQRAEVQAATRRSAPDLFPADYVFGAGNPIFTRQ